MFYKLMSIFVIYIFFFFFGKMKNDLLNEIDSDRTNWIVNLYIFFKMEILYLK